MNLNFVTTSNTLEHCMVESPTANSTSPPKCCMSRVFPSPRVYFAVHHALSCSPTSLLFHCRYPRSPPPHPSQWLYCGELLFGYSSRCHSPRLLSPPLSAVVLRKSCSPDFATLPAATHHTRRRHPLSVVLRRECSPDFATLPAAAILAAAATLAANPHHHIGNLPTSWGFIAPTFMDSQFSLRLYCGEPAIQPPLLIAPHVPRTPLFHRLLLNMV